MVVALIVRIVILDLSCTSHS